MGIPRPDFFDFLFNRGRGIRPNQVDWSQDDTELDTKIAAQSQAAAVDATARASAATAQGEIDAHEASSQQHRHGIPAAAVHFHGCAR